MRDEGRHGPCGYLGRSGAPRREGPERHCAEEGGAPWSGKRYESAQVDLGVGGEVAGFPSHENEAGRPGVVLALDLGSRCGWAAGPCPGLGSARLAAASATRGLVSLPAGGGAVYGVWDIRPTRGESPGVRYLRLRARLEEARAALPALAFVAYEQCHHRGGYATEYALGCAATVQAWCAERGVEHAAPRRDAVLRWAVSRSRAAKETVVREACRRYGREDLSEDEADALLTLEYALVQFAPGSLSLSESGR